MAPKSKSIFRQPGTQHFQLVHRSQRDPLSHDPEAGSHVLKPVVKGKSRAELEQLISPDDLAHDLERSNIGEAALHGVYYDDTDYDYMQHLREVGRAEEGVEAILIEAPKLSKKGKGKAREPIELRSLPDEALPSKNELSREDVLESKNAIPSQFDGLQPDMNPHLRQTMEALDDDAFVDEAMEDDFFAELVGEGEVSDEDEGPHFEFSEWGAEDDEVENEEDSVRPGTEEGSWEARFARFKKDHEAKAKAAREVDEVASDIRSEGGDTIGKLPSISVIGGKKRRKGASEASGYSMSSSSMFRNENLTMLDERFDDEFAKTYEESDEEEELSEDDDSDAPPLITSREDFNAIMDDFLDNYEVFGGKMHKVLPGDSNADKLGTIRRSFKEIGYDPYQHLEEDEKSDDTLEDLVEDKKERWDCETILSTYSNLENHPSLIRARDTSKIAKIRINPKTGVPSLEKVEETPESETSDEKTNPIRITITRPKNETKDEKRARKHAVKEERQARRADRKEAQHIFADEKQQHMRNLKNAKKGVRTLQ